MGLFTSKAQRLTEKGCTLLYGKGDESRGMQCIEQAAAAGDNSARLFLAELYCTGRAVCRGEKGSREPLCVPQDAPRALELYRALPQTLLVKFREGMLLCSTGDECDDERARQLLCEVRDGDAEPAWDTVWMLDRFCFDRYSGAAAETLRAEAGMRAAAMQYWGRGTKRDFEEALRVLEGYDALRAESETAEREFWDPDVLFCLEALRLWTMGEQRYYNSDYPAVRLPRLAWIYSGTADPEIERQLEEEMLVPRIGQSLRTAAGEDTLTHMKGCLSAMQTVCAKRREYTEAMGDIACECIAPLKDRFLDDKNYFDYFRCLELCSAGLDNLGASCRLATLYLSATVAYNSSGAPSVGGAAGHAWMRDYRLQAREVMRRMAKQITALGEGKRSRAHTARRLDNARTFVEWFAEEARAAAPEEYAELCRLLGKSGGETSRAAAQEAENS